MTWWAVLAAVFLGTVAGMVASAVLAWWAGRLWFRRAARRAEDRLVAAYSGAGKPPK